MYQYLFLIVAALTFVGIFICLVIFYHFYKKHDQQLSSIFAEMNKKKLIQSQSYTFYEGLGVYGFGYRVSILSKIIKGKETSLTENSAARGEVAAEIAKKYDLTWLSFFYRMLIVLTIFLAVLIALALISSSL